MKKRNASIRLPFSSQNTTGTIDTGTDIYQSTHAIRLSLPQQPKKPDGQQPSLIWQGAKHRQTCWGKDSG